MKQKILITLAAVVVTLIVAAILTFAVSGTPADNDPWLQNFGIVIVFLSIVSLLGGIAAFAVYCLFKGDGGNQDGNQDKEAEAGVQSLAEHAHYKNGQPFSQVTHTCSTSILQAGPGQTNFCGGKTVVNGEEKS